MEPTGQHGEVFVSRGAGPWRPERPNPSARGCPVESCLTDFKILRLLVVQRRAALFQSVQSLIPDRSLRAGVSSTDSGAVCAPMLWTRSQGSLPSSGPLPSPLKDSGRRLDGDQTARPEPSWMAQTLPTIDSLSMPGSGRGETGPGSFDYRVAPAAQRLP